MNYRNTTVVIGQRSDVVHSAHIFPDSSGRTACGIRLSEDSYAITENAPESYLRYANCERCNDKSFFVLMNMVNGCDWL